MSRVKRWAPCGSGARIDETLVMEENRVEHAPKTLRDSLHAHIEYLRKEIKYSESQAGS